MVMFVIQLRVLTEHMLVELPPCDYITQRNQITEMTFSNHVL